MEDAKILAPTMGQYDALVLHTGTDTDWIIPGPWKLTIQNGGQLRGFVNEEGDFVPETAVAVAKRHHQHP